MLTFLQFLESHESDAKQSLSLLPEKHRKLAKGFRLKFHHAGTLPGDGEHIGKVQDSPDKSITVASPWYYPREFALLHEVGHLVWAKYVKGTSLEKKWQTIL